MKLKLLAYDVEIINVSSDANRLNNEFDGIIYPNERKIYITEDAHFSTYIHELVHFWVEYTGMHYIQQFNLESNCEITAKMIEQLILENGSDIIERIYNFATVKLLKGVTKNEKR